VTKTSSFDIERNKKKRTEEDAISGGGEHIQAAMDKLDNRYKVTG
jgi:hypothetical protein